MFAFAPNYGLDPVRGVPAFVRREQALAAPLIPSTHHRFSGGLPRGLPILFIVRDPRDVLVSAFHHATRHKRTFSGDMDAFLADADEGVPPYLRYMNGWARRAAARTTSSATRT